MNHNRHDFTRQTIEILGKRVGFLCSNPQCGRLTIGPNEEVDKTTSIGVAAHINAASVNGPRYNENQSEAERRNIENGIWLCANCSTLIDRETKTYTAEILKGWKESTEQETRNKLLGIAMKAENNNPFLEADLIWTSTSRAPRGYSSRNLEKFGGNVIPAGGKPIIFWELGWRFTFSLYNNSKYPAYNISIAQQNGTHFSEFPILPKTNNLPPFENIDFDTKIRRNFEGDHSEADAIMKPILPEYLNGEIIRISYFDEIRKPHSTVVSIENGSLTNTKAE